MGSNNNPGNDKNAGNQGSDRVQEVEQQRDAAGTKMSDESFDLQVKGSPEAKGENTADKNLPYLALDMGGGDKNKDAGDNREAGQFANASDRSEDRNRDRAERGEGERGGRRNLENGRTRAEVSEDGNEVSSRVGDTEVRHNRRDRSSEVRRGNDHVGMHDGDCDRGELRRRSQREENRGNVQANENGDRAVSDEDTTVEQNGDEVTFRDNHRGRHHGRHHGRGHGHGHGDGERDEQKPESQTQTQTPGDTQTADSQTQTPAEVTNPETGDQTNERGDGDGRGHHDRDMGDFTLRRGEDRNGPRHLIVDGQDLGTLDSNMSAETLAKAGLTRVDDNTYRMENGRTFEVNERGRVKFGSRDMDGNENQIEMGENDANGQPVVKQDGITISHIPGGGTQVTEPNGNVYTQKDGEFHAHNSEGEELQAFNYDTGDFSGLDLSFDADDPFFSMGGGFSDAPLFGDAGYDASTVYGEEERAPDAPAESQGAATSATQQGTAAVINITNLSGTVTTSDVQAAFGAAGTCLTVGNQLYSEYLQSGSEQARALFGDLMAMHGKVVSTAADAQGMAVQNFAFDKAGIRGSLMGEVGSDVAQRFSNINPYKVAQWLSEEVKRGGMIDSSRLANIA